MKICGDWIFYLYAIRGGKIAYSSDARSYYRFHTANSSVQTYSTPAYYREHETVAMSIARLYRVPSSTLAAHRAFIERFFEQNATPLRAEGIAFGDLYDAEKIGRSARERPLNILMASFAFASGGGEIFPIRLANTLWEEGHAITFFDFRGLPMNRLVREMLRPDIAVIELDNRFSNVDGMLESFGIDVIHSHHASVDHFFGVNRDPRRRTPAHVVSMHGMYDAMEPEVFDHTLTDIFPVVSEWVYISEKNLAPFKSKGLYGEERFTKVPNGMQAPRIRRIPRATLGISEDAFVVCVASRAMPEKGWTEAIEVVGEARRRSGVDFQLLLLGDGELYETLEAQGVPHFAHLLGFVKDAVDYYAAADCGMLLTRFAGESFPLTIIECLMAERPMIATDIGEISDMLTNREGEVAGYIAPFQDGVLSLDEIAWQLMELASDSDVYTRAQAIAREVASRFDIGRVRQMYGDLYQRSITRTQRLAPPPFPSRRAEKASGVAIPPP